jgi:hypothetical protein
MGDAISGRFAPRSTLYSASSFGQPREPPMLGSAHGSHFASPALQTLALREFISPRGRIKAANKDVLLSA